MAEFDPGRDVEDAELILDAGAWPNFHDAEVHNLNIWRGDVRPQDDVWIGPVMEVSFELCALRKPYIAVLAFHDCEDIRLQAFDHQNALYDLEFALEERGTCRNGTPLTPYICVTFRQAMGLELSFKCFRVRAVAREELPGGE
ncbi:MAG: Imm50 family immunity protein [Halioglobus sp.]|nr:Imm50 family immunity protein [Halioglobus sp.]